MNPIEELENYRIEKKINQSELARLIGITPQRLTRILNGQVKISKDVALQINTSIGLNIQPTTNKISKIKAESTNINIEQNDLMKEINRLTEQLNELRDDKKTLKKVTEDQSKYIDNLTKEIDRLRSQLGNSSHLSEERTA